MASSLDTYGSILSLVATSHEFLSESLSEVLLRSGGDSAVFLDSVNFNWRLVAHKGSIMKVERLHSRRRVGKKQIKRKGNRLKTQIPCFSILGCRIHRSTSFFNSLVIIPCLRPRLLPKLLACEKGVDSVFECSRLIRVLGKKHSENLLKLIRGVNVVEDGFYGEFLHKQNRKITRCKFDFLLAPMPKSSLDARQEEMRGKMYSARPQTTEHTSANRKRLLRRFYDDAESKLEEISKSKRRTIDRWSDCMLLEDVLADLDGAESFGGLEKELTALKVRKQRAKLDSMSSLIGIKDSILSNINATILSIERSITKRDNLTDRALDDCLQLLSRRPQSIQDISESQKEFNDMIVPAAPFGGEQQLHLRLKRERVLDMAQAFEEMLASQKDLLRSKVLDAATEIQQEITDKFRFPKHFDREAIEIAFQDHDDLTGRYDRLVKSFEAFDMGLPTSVEECYNATVLEREAWEMVFAFHNELNNLAQTPWIEFRKNVFSLADFCERYTLQMNASVPKIMIGVIENCEFLKSEICPALKYCIGTNFKEEHWTCLFIKIGVATTVKRLDQLTLGDLIRNPPPLQFAKQLAQKANAEILIRDTLNDIGAWIQTAEVSLPLQASVLEDIFDKLETLDAAKSSEFYHGFVDLGSSYEAKMTRATHIFRILLDIQRKWIYLKPISEQLPNKISFSKLDQQWVYTRNAIEADSKLFSLLNLPLSLDSVLLGLEQCQKELNVFLERKRNDFPRFYFIGDDDLLSILGNKDKNFGHLNKLFSGVKSIIVDRDGSISCMCSAAPREVVQLSVRVSSSEQDAEIWLDHFVESMRESLSSFLEESDDENVPVQILSLSEQVRFAQSVEQREISLEEIASRIRDDLHLLANHNGQARGDMTSEFSLAAFKNRCLILDLVHMLDIVDHLVKNHFESPADWCWKKQLKYYVMSTSPAKLKKGVQVRMADAVLDYTFEYLGSIPKLVRTPLTDKCYLTLCQGMHMGFGGNPYGPAGTGKTESVKALGHALGRQVLVFNCDEGIDFKAMGRIFVGVVKSGAWGCFDEFNRLRQDQLSAISQQIQSIQDALLTKSPKVLLLGKLIEVDHKSGIFVTLNPAGKDYGGRSQIPNNLKALFRPVAMGHPDNELIAEVYLTAEGFTRAKTLAAKLIALFSLAKQSLTQQKHYDWGLRALKSVLKTAAKLAVSESLPQNADSSEEAEVIIKAVRINTLSKLKNGDITRFLGILSDIFPGVPSTDSSGGVLESALKEALRESQLEEDSSQLRKMLELKEAMDQRMGCVIVGPSGSGKTTVWKTLLTALTKVSSASEKHMIIKTHVLNPKAMPRSRLLGKMDLDTREWTDGVLTAAARLAVNEPSSTWSWVVCDGDIDPEWIEALNSVLDDNHLLTLPNGERIEFGKNVRFLFETHDLKYASPATVSRMGIISLSNDELDMRCVFRRLSLKSGCNDDENVMQLILNAIDTYRKDYQAHEIVETTMIGTIMNVISSLPKSELPNKAALACALARGLGGNLPKAERSKLAKQIFALCDERPPDYGAPLDCDINSETGLLFSLASHAEELRSERRYEGTDATDTVAFCISTEVVPTISSCRTLAALAPWVDSGEPFMIVGPKGCGKSLVMRKAFERAKFKVSFATIHCSAQTRAACVAAKIAQACTLISGFSGGCRKYRPRDADRLVLFLKDLNLPKPDTYETSEIVTFVHSLLTLDGFYDDSLEFLRLEHVQIVISINPTTTLGRHPLGLRFTTAVRVLVVDYPDALELTSICTEMLHHVSQHFEPSGDNFDPSSSDDRIKLAAAMVDVYERICQEFSVDEQRHYLFTPRELSSWVLGLLRYKYDDAVKTHPTTLLDAAAHEARRLFLDRMVDANARERLERHLCDVWRKNFGISAANLPFTTLQADGSPRSSASDIRDPRLIGVSPDTLEKRIQCCLQYYERENVPMKLHMVEQTIKNIAIIDHGLSNVGGSLLLVGRAGVGRKDMTRLVTCMHGAEFFSPSIPIGGDRGLRSFKAELRSVISAAGNDNRHVVLYIEDRHLGLEGALELINSLLAAGEAPGLFSSEEFDAMLSGLHDHLRDTGVACSLHDFFSTRIKENLHICLAMDPTHQEFPLRCEAYPSIFARCRILWIDTWTDATKYAIPTLLDGVREMLELETTGSERENGLADHVQEHASEGLPSLSKAIVDIHDTAGTACSPYEFLALLETWQVLHEKLQTGFQRKIKHLEAGLCKLSEASQTVDDLSRNATVEQTKLHAAQKSADQAMHSITETLSQATIRRSQLDKLKSEVSDSERATLAQQQEIKKELESITPVLEMAKAAVGQIKAEHLNEIRSLKMPPEPIADVLGAVLKLLGVSDVSWTSMKKFLGNRGVKDEILNYDAHRISSDMRRDIARLLKNKHASFDQANITRVSAAAAPLAAWVKANIRYSVVLEKIEPLERRLQDAEVATEKCRLHLAECEAEMSEIDSRVSVLKCDFGEKTRDAELLKQHLEKAQATLDKAQSLLSRLGGERERWQMQSAELDAERKLLPRQLLLAAGFVTHLAKLPEDDRTILVKSWTKLTGLHHSQSHVFKLWRILSSESQLSAWKQLGLPTDSLSQENALVFDAVCRTNCRRVPIIIDPSRVAERWLRSHRKLSGPPLTFLQASDSRLAHHLELAIRFGKSVAIVDVDGLEPALYPLARRDVELCSSGDRRCIRLGEKKVDFHDDFVLTLMTRDSSHKLSPDVAALLVEINFTVTRGGLEEQLLVATLQHERPELEIRKGELLRQEEEYKLKLADLERDLLENLATAEGDLLENAHLIDSLTRTKSASREIKDALDQSAETSAEIDLRRDAYRPLARAASDLFFLVTDLVHVNNMYQFSQNEFIQSFKKVLAASDEPCDTLQKQDDSASDSAVLNSRLNRLMPGVERAIFLDVSIGIFKADRTMFALHLVHGARPKLFGEAEWELFTGISSSHEAHEKRKSCIDDALPAWASSDRTSDFEEFCRLLPGLAHSLTLADSSAWSRWAKTSECERKFPDTFVHETTPFQRVLVCKTFRPDRLMSALHGFCAEALKVSSISRPNTSLADINTSADVPTILISSGAADPTNEFRDFATSSEQPFEALSMGGGTHETASRMLDIATREGSWMCLQNLHLVVAWLPSLEKQLSAAIHTGVNESFRLWLTTEQHPAFPGILLRRSLKITFESPPGTKHNMMRSLHLWGREAFDRHSPSTRLLLFKLAWFHALLHERTTFAPQGWTKPYEFSVGDLHAGALVMSSASSSENPKTNATILGLLGDAIYGGRVDNVYDAKVLRVYLRLVLASDTEVSGGCLTSLGGPMKPSHPNSYDECVSAVEGLCEIDSPKIFGLPDNIERSVQRVASTCVANSLRRLASASATSNNFEREHWRHMLTPIIEHWDTLNGRKLWGLNPKAVVTDYCPLVDFVRMEQQKAYILCDAIETSLSALKRLLLGTTLLTPAVFNVASSLISSSIPLSWRVHWDAGPQDKPNAWLAVVVKKANALFADWTVPKDELLSRPLDLGDLFRPAAFLNSLRQLTARNTKCAIPDLVIVSEWSEANLPCNSVKVACKNLQLQGANLAIETDRITLIEPSSDTPEVISAPPLYIAFANTDEVALSLQHLQLPLYLDLSRQTLLVDLNFLSNAGNSDKWILAGTALFLADSK